MPDDLEARLRAHVNVLAELIGPRDTLHPRSLENTRAYLTRTLNGCGLDVTAQQFETSQRIAVNLEVLIPGSNPSLATLVIGAHYDTVPSTPGADDNASAVAILLEIAAAIARAEARRSVRLVFYDCEEPPHFLVGEMGSQHHSAALRRSGESIAGMVCLESLGYFVRRPNPSCVRPLPLRLFDAMAGGRHVVIVSNFRSLLFAAGFLARFATSGLFPFVPVVAPRKFNAIELSDHRSYWDQGFPALMVTDTAFLRNPNYHRATDRLDTLDLPRMTRLCHQLIRTTQRLAGCRPRR